MKASLVRIGVDQAYGKWNAPVNADGRFVYVPIPEKIGTEFHPLMERRYAEVKPALEEYCVQNSCDLRRDLKFPDDLTQHPMHLDPDFEKLTYGDDGGQRGTGFVGMCEGDLLVFYAGMRPTHRCDHRLIYALTGLYVVKEVVAIHSVAQIHWNENAHTRKRKWGDTDIIVRAKPAKSGRLERCIGIGEHRSGAYRVRQDILDQWGGLSVKNGFIQRSAVPPAFKDPERFYDWFLRQNVRLIARNN